MPVIEDVIKIVGRHGKHRAQREPFGPLLIQVV